MGTNGTRLTKQYGLCEARTTKTADTGHSVTRPRPTKTQNRAGRMQTRSISRNPLTTQPTKRDVNFSRRSVAEPKRQALKFEMPPVVQLIPRASTGRNAFEWEASFDMTRSRSLISEDIEGLFGLPEIITFPGPVGLTDADGRDWHCLGEIMFNVTIVKRTTSVTTWITYAIKRGHLVIGAGTMEDLGLFVSNVPDNTNPRGHAQETRTVRIQARGSAQTRSARVMTNRQSNTQPQSSKHDVLKGEDNNFMIPFHMGFRREVVIGSDGERMSIYYITPDRKTKVASRTAMQRYLNNNPTEGLSISKFCRKKIILGIDNPERETVRMARNQYSNMWSTPQMGRRDRQGQK